MAKKCRLCEQKLKPRTKNGHHQEVSPIESNLCLGCFHYTLETELFLIRKVRPDLQTWSLVVQERIKELLTKVRKEGLNPK